MSMSSGAAFSWTFPQEFTGNVAPTVESTDISHQGQLTTGVQFK